MLACQLTDKAAFPSRVIKRLSGPSNIKRMYHLTENRMLTRHIRISFVSDGVRQGQLKPGFSVNYWQALSKSTKSGELNCLNCLG